MPNYKQPGKATGVNPSFGSPTFSPAISMFANGGGVPQASSASSDTPDRPYGNVGKFGLNLMDINQQVEENPDLQTEGGLFTGFFGGIGNTFGTEGRQAGEMLGGLIEAPLGLLGGVMGAAGGIGIHVRDETPTDINPAFEDLSAIDSGGNITVGSITQSALGIFGLLGRVVERAYAGTESRVLPSDLAAKVAAGTMTREEAADILVSRGAGFTDNMAGNIALSIILDPLTWLTLGVGGIAKGASAVEKIGVGLGKAEKLGDWVDSAGRLTAGAARAAQAAGDTPITRLGRLESLGLHTFGHASSLTPDSAFVRVANQVTRITDPLKMFGGGDIGKRTTDHVMAAAVDGFIASHGPGVVRAVEAAFDAAGDGAGARLDRAIGTSVTNLTYRWIADEYIGDALRAAGDAPGANIPFVAGQEGIGLTPNELVRVTLENKGVDRSIGTQIELLTERVKPMLANMSEEEMARQTIAKAARIAGVDEAAMAKALGKVDYDKAALIHAAFYADLGRELIDEVVPGLRGAMHVLPKGVIPERLTLIGERTFTQVRRDELKAAIAAKDGKRVREIVDKIEDFDFINQKGIDVSRNDDLFSLLDEWLKVNGDTALTEIPLRDAAGVVRADIPAPLRHWMEDADQYGYRLAMTPEGTPEQLFRITRDAQGRLINARPWLNFVSQGTEFVAPGRMSAFKMAMTRQIRAEKIVWRNRRTFVRNLTKNHGIAAGTAERMFRTILYAASERGIAPRGLRPEEIMDAARKAINEEAKTGGGLRNLTERQLTRELLVAFRGDFTQVGVTQAFTGAAKVALPGAGGNFWGGLAEKVYPMVKFTFSPWFMLQEYTEPYILNIMRGVPTPLRRSSKGYQEALATRTAIAQFLRSDLGRDGALMEMAEYQRMLAGSMSEVHHRLGGTVTSMSEGLWGNIAERKSVATALLAKRLFGQRLRETFTEIRGPEYWRQLEQHFGTTDPGELAMRWMAENSILRDANGERITAVADMLKPENFGQHTRIFRGQGEGVRFHHLAHYLGRTDDVDGEGLVKALMDGHQAALNGVDLPEGALSYDDFLRQATEAGLPQEFAQRAYHMATGPEVDEFWTSYQKAFFRGTVKGTKAKRAELEMHRALVQVRSATMGITEEEYIKTHFAAGARRLTTERALNGTEVLFEHRSGMFGEGGEFAQRHGGSLAAAREQVTSGGVNKRPAAYAVDSGRVFLRDERGMPNVRIPAASKPEREAFEIALKDDLDSWMTTEIPRVGKPNAIERIDGNMKDWEGAPSLVIVGEEMPVREADRMTVYLQRDSAGEIAGYTVISQSGDMADSVVSTMVRPDVRRRGIGSRMYEAADRDGMAVGRVTGQHGVTPAGKEFSEAYRNRPFNWEPDPPVRQSVMDELDDSAQSANMFNYMVVNEPETLRAAIADGRIDPKHAKKIEQAIETAQAQLPRPRAEFTRENGMVERYGLVTADDLLSQNLEWMTTKEGIAAGNWYPDMRNRFVRLFGEDHGPVLLAFAVSQASAAPTNGMKNALHVIEQLFTDGFEARVLDVSREASTKNPIRLMAGTKRITTKENWDRLGLSARGRERALQAVADGLEKDAGIKITGELNEENIVKALMGMKIEGGFGPKLNDFLDSLLGNQTRRWTGRLGQHSPVAVDRWTARDVGFLDDVTLDHLASTYGKGGAGEGVVAVTDKQHGVGKVLWHQRKEVVGYQNNKPVMGWRFVDEKGNYVTRDGKALTDAEGKLLPEMEPEAVADFTGAPKEYGYEHGVRTINEAVEKFNNYVGEDGVQGVWGRTDWTAADVQAVGWIRMQKVMGGAEESPFMTFAANTYETVVNAAPEVGTDLADRARVVERLHTEDRLYVTQQLSARIGRDIADDWGMTTVVSDEAHYAETVTSRRPIPERIEIHTRTPEGWTRGRHVTPDEMGRLMVRGERIVTESLAGEAKPIVATTDDIAATLQERVATAWNGSEDWGGGTFNPVTGDWVTPDEGRFVSGVGQTIRLSAEEAKDPDTFKAAIEEALKDERMGHDGYVIGVFNDKDAGNVVDIDVALMVKGDVADAEAVQAHLAREGGAFDFVTEDGVYRPLTPHAGVSAPFAVLTTPSSAIDFAERMAITTRRETVVPLRVSNSGFKVRTHRPVVDMWFPEGTDAKRATDNLLAFVNALRDEQEALPINLRRTFEYHITKDEAGRYGVRIIDDANPGQAFFARRAENGVGVAEKKGMVDPEALEARYNAAAEAAGIAQADRDALEFDYFHADLYRAKPIKEATVAPRRLTAEEGNAIEAAGRVTGDAGQQVQRDLVGQGDNVIPGFGAMSPEDYEKVQIAEKVAGFRSRGRSVSAADVHGWRASYAEHLDALLQERAPENLGRSLRGEPLLERRTGTALGYTERADDGRRVIGAFRNADPVTGLHELTHVFATDLDESARRIVIDARATAVDARRTDIAARIDALESRIAAAKSRTTKSALRKQVVALRNELGSVADEAAWGTEHEEFFVSEFQKWLRSGRAPNQKLEGVFAHFKNWLDSVWSAVKGQRGMESEAVSPEMTRLFEEMFSGVPSAASSNYDVDQHVLKMAAHNQLRLAQDEAFTTQYFKMGRNFMERSLNHPFFGLYPLSYMWGKVLPEMFRFLALRPFGVPAPMVAWNSLNEVSDSVKLQQQTDPAFAEFIDNNADLWSTMSSLFPALPNEIPVNAPLWMRRISEQGLENKALAERGKAVKNIDLAKGVTDQAAYIFGPVQSWERVADAAGSFGDIFRSAVGMEQPDPKKEAARKKAASEAAAKAALEAQANLNQ